MNQGALQPRSQYIWGDMNGYVDHKHGVKDITLGTDKNAKLVHVFLVTW